MRPHILTNPHTIYGFLLTFLEEGLVNIGSRQSSPVRNREIIVVMIDLIVVIIVQQIQERNMQPLGLVQFLEVLRRC
jgi:hypothetical protein